MNTRIKLTVAFLLLTLFTRAQEYRTQYPFGLKNAYFGVNIGYINYPFSSAQLEPGFSTTGVKVPHTAVRLVLYGLPINEYLSARITYMRPVLWVEYKDINGVPGNRSVWMNVAGLTLEGRLPVTKKFSVAGEAGLGIITRNGFTQDSHVVVSNANYASWLFGGSLQYHVNKKWDLQINAAYTPANNKVKQPATSFVGAGFNYRLAPLPQERVERNAKSGYYFPKHFLLAGYTTNGIGYGVNNVVANKHFPIFWGGAVKLKQGFTLSYQRNIFHGGKVFAMDWAAKMGYWQSAGEGKGFFSASLNPVFRFHVLRSTSTDLFLEYSVAGPTFMSEPVLDGIKLGEKFTFYDFMGIGAFTGKNKQLYTGIRIGHFSNGNLFPYNDGVMIPLTFQLGYVLDRK